MGDRKDYKDEENRSFLVVLVVIAAIAFLFQLIGFFGPGWMVYDLGHNPNYQFFTGHGSYGGSYGGVYGNTYGQGGYPGAYNPNYGTGGYGTGYNPVYTGGAYGGSYGTGYNPGAGQTMLGQVVISAKVGIWAYHVCVDYGIDKEDCKLTMKKMRTILGENDYSSTNTRSGTDKLLSDKTVQKVLSTIAIVLAFVALVFNVLLFTPIVDSKKLKRIVCAACWFISGILWFAAIGVQGKEIEDLKDTYEEYHRIYPGKYEFDNYFPWSLFLLGVSAFMGLVEAVLVLVLLPRCVQHSYEGASMSDRI